MEIIHTFFSFLEVVKQLLSIVSILEEPGLGNNVLEEQKHYAFLSFVFSDGTNIIYRFKKKSALYKYCNYRDRHKCISGIEKRPVTISCHPRRVKDRYKPNTDVLVEEHATKIIFSWTDNNNMSKNYEYDIRNGIQCKFSDNPKLCSDDTNRRRIKLKYIAKDRPSVINDFLKGL